ncbi:MAG: ATP-dependent transcriptional regulator [Bacteroidetes bacterium]|nr:ATP-dependent transcriptional regulator [Bacteroidota bacterium]
MISSNRKYIRLRSNIAVQNLAMLHKSFDGVEDEECQLALMLNDSFAVAIFGGDYAGAIEISLAALENFHESNLHYLMAEHESLLGRCYTYITQYATAREHLLRAEALAFHRMPDTDEARGLRADILHNLAMNNHHADTGDDLTVAYLERALGILEGTDFSNRKGICLMGIGNVRMTQGRQEEALSYQMRAMELFEDAETFTNLSTVYSNIGTCYTHLGQFESAEVYIMRGLDMRTRMGSYWEIANSYYSLASLYVKKGETDIAYENLLISRDYAMVSQARGIQRMILEELESMAISRGDLTAAEEHRSQLMEVGAIAA